MSTLTRWVRSLGTAGAVVNARLDTDRSSLAHRAIDEMEARLPATSPSRRRPAA